MLNDIKLDLADNFRTGDDAILQKIIDEVTNSALSISNRKNTESNINLLSAEIKKCVKSKYLQRGSEGSKSLNDNGANATLTDPDEELRVNIVKSGKRLPNL